MAREARIVIPGVAHHITQRGNYGQDVFVTDDDRVVYLRYLRESARQSGLDVTAYCLMTNHVHLVAVPKRKNSLAKALGRAHLMYAQHFNRTHGLVGHLWQARFYSCPLDDAHADNAALYVELNPVRAKLVRAPWRYPWSSAAAHCGRGGDASGLLDLSAWFEEVTPEWWQDALKAGLDDEEIAALQRHTSTGRPLGDNRFLDRIEKSLRRTVRARPPGRPKGSRDTKRRKKP